MTIQEAHKQLVLHLRAIYDEYEAPAITDLVMENITSSGRIDRVINKHHQLSIQQQQLYDKYLRELADRKPVQYILQEAWFCGLKFYVDENVLIPRPETEELVEWIVSENNSGAPRILDIGTGSGCIAIALKKKLPHAHIYACDISSEALAVAKRNMTALGVQIELLTMNILDPAATRELPPLDIIVSNPPYIPLAEKTGMNENVTSHEPHLALFVKDNDPLQFYKAIADISATKKYVEVHENMARQTAALFPNTVLRKDMQGKERMLRSTIL